MGNCLIMEKRLPNTDTYTPGSNSSALDMGIWNRNRYINTTSLYTTAYNSGNTAGYNSGYTAGWNAYANDLAPINLIGTSTSAWTKSGTMSGGFTSNSSKIWFSPYSQSQYNSGSGGNWTNSYIQYPFKRGKRTTFQYSWSESHGSWRWGTWTTTVYVLNASGSTVASGGTGTGTLTITGLGETAQGYIRFNSTCSGADRGWQEVNITAAKIV